MSDIAQEVQKEVRRIRDMLNTTKNLFPNGKGNFAIYDILILEAERAVREQDTTVLSKLLPELQRTH